jgi:hypothetical protein
MVRPPRIRVPERRNANSYFYEPQFYLSDLGRFRLVKPGNLAHYAFVKRYSLRFSAYAKLEILPADLLRRVNVLTTRHFRKQFSFDPGRPRSKCFYLP